jgi:hypothetical protein
MECERGESCAERDGEEQTPHLYGAPVLAHADETWLRRETRYPQQAFTRLQMLLDILTQYVERRMQQYQRLTKEYAVMCHDSGDG